MSFWVKILGGVAGLALGGPFGAVVGAALGHAAENGALGGGRLFDNLLGGSGIGGSGMSGSGMSGAGMAGAGAGGTPMGGADRGFATARIAAMFGRRDEVFALCVVVLSAKLAKCDGPVNRTEIAAFKQAFRIPPEAARDIGRLFDTARDSASGYEEYASQLGDSFADTPSVLEDVLSALFAIARADRPLTQPELRFLQAVWQRLGLSRAAWERASDPGSRPHPASKSEPLEDAFAVLGLPSSASDEALHSRWKQLMRENHPDTLASRGVPADFIAHASDTVARINAAWDRIKRERRL